MESLPLAELITIGTALFGAAMLGLANKYRIAKNLLGKLDTVLTDATSLIVELDELVSELNAALEDDNLSQEEATRILEALQDVIQTFKILVGVEECEECDECTEQ